MDEVNIRDIVEVWIRDALDGLPVDIKVDQYGITVKNQNGVDIVLITTKTMLVRVFLYDTHADIVANYVLSLDDPESGERIRTHVENNLG